MTSTFDSAVAGMAKAVRSSRGVAVTYHRGSEALPITATPAEDRYAINDADGVPVQMFVRDYLFSAADHEDYIWRVVQSKLHATRVCVV